MRTKINPSGELFRTINFQVGRGFYLDFLDSEILIHLSHRLYRLRQCLVATAITHYVAVIILISYITMVHPTECICYFSSTS